MAFTYTAGTTAGNVRLLVSDTSATGYTWEDAEITAALDMASSNVFDAAALLLESAAASFKKLLSIRLFGELSLSVTEQQRELAALAREYREIARCDAAAQMAQMQSRIDRYGRDHTDYSVTTAKTSDDFEDYSEDEIQVL